MPLEETTADGYPKRTELFVDLVTETRDTKGNLETEATPTDVGPSDPNFNPSEQHL
ncbi:hypothetical protein HYG81_23135 (plasmid) [Natrinema zhouii]|uniref:hypothetical protein n=1 Tax=Natrinema zhouii TaxID=1710539 RepID=UPI001CFF86F3|nr:hypothetical protein [Natrinema zhouii]UHQ98481.1 hypothetical protein HYG81_23135 [Natrinema zhouii]